MEGKFYYLFWGNGMVGFFKDDFEQCANVDVEYFDKEVEYLKSLYHFSEVRLVQIHSHWELNHLREINGYNKKTAI